MNLNKLLKPKSVAVIGASERAGFGGGTTKNIVTYRKDLSRTYFVHPSRPEVLGQKTYPKIADIPDEIDLAIICTPQETVIPLLHEVHDKGCTAAVVYASGYSEIGSPEGDRLEKELYDTAKELGIAIMGPNCGGFVNYVDDVWSFAFLGNYADKRGRLGFVSQSGKFCIDLMNAPELKFSYSISAGNSRTVQMEDYFDFLINDPDTGVIAIYLEGVNNPARFEQSLATAARMGKPIIVLKMGRSPKGAASAASHTGSFAGSDKTFDALFAKYGVIRVDDMQDLRSTAALFDTLPALPKKAAFASINFSGGETGVCADTAYMYDIPLPDLSESTCDKLRELLPSYATPKNPLDMTATMGGIPDGFPRVVKAVMSDESIEAGLIGWTITMAPAEARLQGIIDAAKECGKPLIVVNFMEFTRNPEVVATLVNNRIPVLPTLKYAYSALRHLCKFINYQADKHTLALAIPEKDLEKAATRSLSEYESKKMLADGGIKVDLGGIATSAQEAASLAKSAGFPAVLKIESDEILHKTDVGGVKLRLNSEAEVTAAFDEIMGNIKAKAPGAKYSGVQVQKMLPAGVEMIIGVSRDQQFGPMMLVGLGGVFVELFRDVALYPAPIGKVEAQAMLESLKGYKLLAGYRGSKPCDIEALTDMMVAVSDFAVKNKDTVKELDINPLFVYPKGEGVAVVDALVVRYE